MNGPSRCPLCDDPDPPGKPCPPGGRHCPRCGSVLWPEPTTRPRGEVSWHFAGPRHFEIVREVVTLNRSLCGLMAELADLKRRIEQQRRRRPSRLAGWLSSLRRLWHRLLIARKPRPAWHDGSGVSDPWID